MKYILDNLIGGAEEKIVITENIKKIMKMLKATVEVEEDKDVSENILEYLYSDDGSDDLSEDDDIQKAAEVIFNLSNYVKIIRDGIVSLGQYDLISYFKGVDDSTIEDNAKLFSSYLNDIRNTNGSILDLLFKGEDDEDDFLDDDDEADGDTKDKNIAKLFIKYTDIPDHLKSDIPADITEESVVPNFIILKNGILNKALIESFRSKILLDVYGNDDVSIKENVKKMEKMDGILYGNIPINSNKGSDKDTVFDDELAKTLRAAASTSASASTDDAAVVEVTGAPEEYIIIAVAVNPEASADSDADASDTAAAAPQPLAPKAGGADGADSSEDATAPQPLAPKAGGADGADSSEVAGGDLQGGGYPYYENW